VMTNAIEVRGLSYRAGRTFSIDELQLTVPRGSIYGFLGPNGAGKTTTIRLLLGMTRPLAGEIRVLGQRVPSEVAQALARTGYVPERPHLYAALTVAESMRFHAAFFPHWDALWATRLLEMFELPVERRVGKLSKGETGKLMILLALAQRPELLVLDEPTDGLDPMVRRDVLTAVLDYVGDAGATVFISSHLVHELERMCDWVGVLDRGRLIAEMPMAAFKGSVKRIRLAGAPAPAHPGELPFTLLTRSRDALAPSETWVVRGWDEPMLDYFDATGATVRDVADLDLEDAFVELLRAARQGER
jgi:ABC-2 type transport system ATP-binding protein